MTDTPIAGDPKQAARAIDALRRGWAVSIDSASSTTITVLAIERVFDATWLSQGKGILLSASRAGTLRLANQRDAAQTHRPVQIAVPPGADISRLMAIADPVRDLASPLKGPFSAQPIADVEAAETALELARLAGVLPAFLIVDATSDAHVAPADVTAFKETDSLEIAARTRLPIEGCDKTEIVAFRSKSDSAEHVALIIGRPDGNPPLVRVHSECLTGDIFGSLKCDCGPQLSNAINDMIDTGWGILIYLRQEGRGIGLINKLRAYQLQEQGFDTVDANIRLGFAIDARDFSIAAHMLKLLGVDQIRLLTNNPEKVARLSARGLNVVERVEHKIDANRHNERYLETKRDRTGHQL